MLKTNAPRHYQEEVLELLAVEDEPFIALETPLPDGEEVLHHEGVLDCGIKSG